MPGNKPSAMLQPVGGKSPPLRPTHAFRLPANAETYNRAIERRSEELIEAGIWTGLHVQRLRAWLANFQTPEERYFASCVLDALVYRTHDQTAALMTQLFQRTIPDLLQRDSDAKSVVPDYHDRLATQVSDPRIRVVPVLRSSDPPTKSGPFITRILKRNRFVSERWVVWPWDVGRQIAGGANLLLFVDDFMGTGDQFADFVNSMGLDTFAGDACMIYAPLVAHERGISTLRGQLHGFHFACVEILDDSYNLFSPDAGYFDDGVNSACTARTFYEDFLARRCPQAAKTTPLGYGGLGLVLAFEHAIPDNTLPILWARDPTFHPLFDR